MAPSLTLLPPEIRNQIYGYLLRDTNIEFDLTHKPVQDDTTQHSKCEPKDGTTGNYSADKHALVFIKNKDQPQSIHTAILTPCRQIYNEAVAVLYEENCFVHRLWQSLHAMESRDLEIGFPMHKLDMIKNLELVVEQDNYDVTPNMVVEALRYFSMANCSLKRLVM